MMSPSLWLLRRYLGKHKSAKDKLVAKYRVLTLGLADDSAGNSCKGESTEACCPILN